jgi:putative transposase
LGVATRLGVGPHTIGKWRNRFIADRIEGLYDEMRSGRPGGNYPSPIAFNE